MEILVIAALSVMVFGRDLPRVAAQAYSRFQKVRRALMQVWRDSGIGEEMRQMQREIDRGTEAIRRASPKELARKTLKDVEAEVKSPFESASVEDQREVRPEPPPEEELGAGARTLAEEPEEPAGESERRPPWYPEVEPPPGQPSGSVETQPSDEKSEGD